MKWWPPGCPAASPPEEPSTLLTDAGSAHLGLIKCSEFKKKKKIKLPVPRVADTEAPPLRTNYSGDREEPGASSHKAQVSTRVLPADTPSVVHARRVPCGSFEGPPTPLSPPRAPNSCRSTPPLCSRAARIWEHHGPRPPGKALGTLTTPCQYSPFLPYPPPPPHLPVPRCLEMLKAPLWHERSLVAHSAVEVTFVTW